MSSDTRAEEKTEGKLDSASLGPAAALPPSPLRRTSRSGLDRKPNLSQIPLKNGSMPNSSSVVDQHRHQPRIQQPPFPHSSDSLLHHLHTDPQSSHITVCGAASPVAHRHAALPPYEGEGGGATEVLSPGASSNGLLSGTISSVTSEGGSSRPRESIQNTGQSREAMQQFIQKELVEKPMDMFPSSSSKPNRQMQRTSEGAKGTQSLASETNRPRSPGRDRSRQGPALPLLSRSESSSTTRDRPNTAPMIGGRRKSGILLPTSTNELDSQSPSMGASSRLLSGDSSVRGDSPVGSFLEGRAGGASTPGSQKGYFDLQTDRRGKAKIRPSTTTTSVRSRTSTASSLHLGPLPGSTSGTMPVFGDGLITPSTDGHVSVGTERDGDDEMTPDEAGFQDSWPAEAAIAAAMRHEQEYDDRKGDTTNMMMSPARPASNAHSDGEQDPDSVMHSRSTGNDAETILPESGISLRQVHDLNQRLQRLETDSENKVEPEEILPSPTSGTPAIAVPQAAQASGDDCLHQFVQQFQDVLQMKLNHEDQENNPGGLRIDGGPLSPAASSSSQTKLVGSAGSLTLDGLDPPRRDIEMSDDASSVSHRRQVPSNWGLFMQAYTAGRWDPNQIPAPPRSSLAVNLIPTSSSARSSPGASFSSPREGEADNRADVPEYSLDHQQGAFGLASILTRQQTGNPTEFAALTSGLRNGSYNGTTSAPSTAISSSPPRMTRHLSATSLPRRWTSERIEVASPHHRLPSVSQQSISRNGPGQISLNSGAATTMLASQLYSSGALAPLGVPSPERELTDPMASALNSELDSSKPRKNSSSSDSSVYFRPSSRGKISTTAGEWESAKDSLNGRREGMPSILSTIAASPATTPGEGHPEVQPIPFATPSYSRGAAARNGLKHIPPASAPIDAHRNSNSSAFPTDYFGSAAHKYDPTPTATPPSAGPSRHPSLNSRSSSSQTVTRLTLGPSQNPGSSAVTDSEDEMEGSVTAQAFNPQASDSHDNLYGNASNDTDMTNRNRGFPSGPSSRRSSRAMSSEEHYQERGYLRAPIPLNDLQRRKALYRFKLLHTAQDVNFDRIAHLAKLVFSTRIVLISLVDEEHNWHKVELGLGAATAERGDSFCSHVVLSKSSEPMVVLDTHKDWRFQNHPFVLSAPHIRFYAGAPLRTADGYNVGSICIIDSQPRAEFPPRSRMALKEFAGVVVREMELWRDKTRLKARDRIQNSMERFTRECLELDNAAETSPSSANATMEKVYELASKLVCRTLDLDGAIVLDLSQFEPVEMTDSNGEVKRVYQADPYEMGTMTSEDEHHVPHDENGNRSSHFGPLPPWSIMGASETKTTEIPGRNRPASSSDHARFSDFLSKQPEGKIFEQVVPSWIRHILPQGIQFAMIVPIFNIDKHPFALLCAYTCNKAKQFLEGYELQFLRAIGVVILSAVLKRRMILADKAKSNFISNISHELRTPLHGILAAAELLADTKLDSNQESFLSTVQACGNSLIETVNHVLDFTKLSGSAKGAIENVIKPGVVDLAHLVEETVEGCWIGQRARAQQGQSEIGSFYSPPSPGAAQAGDKDGHDKPYVETVIDVGFRERGWIVRCEKGGIRRVLMNLIGNSLKFTRDGYIQVTLRELPHTPGSRMIPVEMAVIDTGKGISRSFLKDQLFHPFSQENPLQTGTGLGLAIVNSIVRSESVNGKVDVWSSEGLGTEIKITLNVELEGSEAPDDTTSSNSSSSAATGYWNGSNTFGHNFTVSMTNFRLQHRGSKLNMELVSTYLQWWAFHPIPEESDELGDIIITDEEGPVLRRLLDRNDTLRAVLILSTNRSARPSTAMSAYQKAGGFVQMVFKPVGPERLQAALRACAQALTNGPTSLESSRTNKSDYFSPPFSPSEASVVSGRPDHLGRGYSNASSTAGSRPDLSRESTATIGSPLYEFQGGFGSRFDQIRQENAPGMLLRRRSEEERHLPQHQIHRPGMSPRSTTYHEARPSLHSMVSQAFGSESGNEDLSSIPGSPSSALSTVSIVEGAVMLKRTSVPPEVTQRKPRILLVDDNHINLELLSAYLRKKKIEFQRCVNGQISVDAFTSVPEGHWDIILMDISMPVMDGIEATRTIRKIEADRQLQMSIETGEKPVKEKVIQQRTKIFALSGRATSDDKKQAFSAGVDGYLVKPVKLATLDAIIKKLGF